MKKLEIELDGREVCFSLPLGDSQGRMSLGDFQDMVEELQRFTRENDPMPEPFSYTYKLRD